jgi:carbon-monoxide dehydrogenase large subunit
MGAPLIGARIQRKEDYRFLTGAGQYTDDVTLQGQTHAVFVRSPHAHAKIKSIRKDKALRAPGVLAVFTGEDLAAAKVGGLPCGWLITDVNGQPMKEPPHPCLALGKARYVGDHVAVVIAETLDGAQDAAELVEVDYEMLPAVADAAMARAKGAPVLHDAAPDNTCYVWALGDKAAADAAFAKAAHVTKLEFINNRLIPNAIEPRAAIGLYSRSEDAYTLYVSNQNPHVERLLMAAFVLGLPEHKLRVVAPDVGGGFGSKIYLYAEDVVVTWASKQINRPVKWTAERSESFVSDAHGRDHHTIAELAMDKDGKFLAMRVKTTANMGAYLSTFASAIPTILYATLLAGQYTTPVIHVEVTAVFTNTAPVDAYRGAGRPEATYVVERLVETAAREMKLDPAEIRRRNFIKSFPYQTPVALLYDIGDYEATMAAAIKLADVAGFPQRRKEAEARGKLRGLGYAAYIEACGIAPSAVAGSLGARCGGRGPVRLADRERRHRARRHLQDPVRHGHLRLALARGGRHGDREGDGQDHRQGQEDRRAPAGGGRGRHRVRERRI